MELMKNTEAPFFDENTPFKFARWGVVQAGAALDRELSVTLERDGDTITGGYVCEDLNEKELYLCGLYAFRTYAMQEHSKYANKAVNFKTINFAVSGLTERAKECMRIVWWVDSAISGFLAQLGAPMGHANEMHRYGGG